MAHVIARRSFPSGTGWIPGYTVGGLAGVLAWLVSNEVILGLIIFVATGTPLAVTFERSLDTRRLTPRERRIVFFLLVVGLVLVVASTLL
jgi:hypothetical protein